MLIPRSEPGEGLLRPQQWARIPMFLTTGEYETARRVGRIRWAMFMQRLILEFKDSRQAQCVQHCNALRHAEYLAGQRQVTVCAKCKRKTFLRDVSSDPLLYSDHNPLGANGCRKCNPDGVFPFRLHAKAYSENVKAGRMKVYDSTVPSDVYRVCRMLGAGSTMRGSTELLNFCRNSNDRWLLEPLLEPVNLDLPMEMPPLYPRWLE